MKRNLLFLAFFLSSVAAHAQTPTLNWERRYNNPQANTTDVWLDMVVDANGNTYVCGYSDGQGSGIDVVAAKYELNGDTAWIFRYNNTLVNGEDVAVALALTNNNDVVVTGHSEQGGNSIDGLTIMISGTNGQIMNGWPQFFNGPANGNDWSNDVSVRQTDNLIAVCGAYQDNNLKRAVVTYEPTGVMNWIGVQYNSSQNYVNAQNFFCGFFNNGDILVVDQEITVTGIVTRDTLANYSILDGTNGNEIGGGITGDLDDNLSGYKFNQWPRDFTIVNNIGYVLVDCHSDNVNLSSFSAIYEINHNSTYIVDPFAIHNFSQPYSLRTTGLAVSNSRIYISGYEDVNSSNAVHWDGFVAVFNKIDGGLIDWENHGSIIQSGFLDIAIDNLSTPNVYVTGFESSAGNRNIITAKYNSLLDLQWDIPFDGTASGIDEGYKIAVGNGTTSGSVWVSGKSAGTGQGDDAILLKYCVPPQVSFSVLNAVCVNASPLALIGGTPTGGVYSGTGVTNGTTFNPQTAGVGTHTITYEFTATNGCSATATRTVTVHPTPPQPTVSNNGPLQFCNGGSVTLSAPANYTYDWNPGTGTSETLQVTATGSYTVTVTDQNGCQSTSGTTAVTVHANPTVSITGQNYFCSGNTTPLVANGQAGSGTITDYQWLLNNGPIGGSISANYSASVDGNYTVMVTNSNNCSTTSSVFVVSEALPPTVPTVNVSGSLEFCEGQSVLLSAVAPNCVGCNFEWQNDGQSAGIGAALAAAQAGDYTVTASNNCGEEVSASAISVIVNPLPSVDAGNDERICSGESWELVGSGNGDCSWLPAAGLSAANSCITNATPSNTTNYILTVTDPATGCLNRDTVEIEVISGQAPVPQFDYTISGNTVVFDLLNDSDYDQVTWYFGDGDSSFVFDPVHPYANNAVGSVVTVWGCINCSDTVICSQSEQLLTVGIEEHEELGLFVSPNPSLGQFELVVPNFFGNCTYQLHDLLGQLLQEGTVTSERTAITMQQVATGIYSLRVLNNSGQSIGARRVVVQ